MWRRWAVAICGSGAALRFLIWWRGLPMWKDELWLAENLASRSPLELFGALESAQAAPWGFLAISDVMHALSGGSIFWLRALPLVASVAALCVFAVFLRERFGSDLWTLVALSLVAFAPVLVYQAAELKPYSVDVFVVCALLLVWHRHGLKWPTVLTGAVAPWLSFPSVFVLAGLGLERLKRAPREVALAGSVWVASFLPHWWFVIRPASQNSTLRDFWQGGFAPAPPETFGWLLGRAIGFFQYPLWFIAPAVALAVAMFGVLRLRRRDSPLAGVLVLVAALTVLASAAGLYPLASRPSIFLLPVGALAVGAGTAFIFDLPERASLIGGAAVVVLVLFNVAASGMMAGCASKLGGERIYDGCLKERPISHGE